MTPHVVRAFPSLLKQSFEDFRQNEPLRLAGATAFFATFALPAILIILIQVFGLIVNPRALSHQIFQNLSGIVGTNTVAELRATLRNVRHLATNWYIAIGGFLFLVFVSTTLFKVIRDSLNQLWKIRVVAHPGFLFLLRNRARSFIVILLVGLLVVALLIAEGVLGALKQSIGGALPSGRWWVNSVIDQLISIVVVTAWFAMLFKLLPDAQLTWRVAIAGALFTAVLFTLGKLALRFLLSYTKMQTIYGTSTSIVLLLLFVFYVSFIFYYGACFTRVWAQSRQQPIAPGKHATRYDVSQVSVHQVR